MKPILQSNGKFDYNTIVQENKQIFASNNKILNTALKPAECMRKGNINTQSGNTGKAQDLQRVYKATGDTGAIPQTQPTKAYFDYGGKTYYMTPVEYTKYQETYGQAAYSALQKLINDSTFKMRYDVA